MRQKLIFELYTIGATQPNKAHLIWVQITITMLLVALLWWAVAFVHVVVA